MLPVQTTQTQNGKAAALGSTDLGMKTLLLIPSAIKTNLAAAVASDLHPRMDFQALREALEAAPDSSCDVMDYVAIAQVRHPLVRLCRRIAGPDLALVFFAFLQRNEYDALFTNGENLGIPLSLLLRWVPRRPGHVTIGHRLSAGKKALFFRLMRVHAQMDTIFVYARTQYLHAKEHLGVPASRLDLIAFHADHCFYFPRAEVEPVPTQVCAAGLEWRDYPTLLRAAEQLPQLCFKLAAASPWSKHRNEAGERALPPNVEVRRYPYNELRQLYAESAAVAVPLYENDFQAGVTTLLEAMAMGKAVIVTHTIGQTDVVVPGETGLTVAPGDVAGWKRAILRVSEDAAFRARLGQNARQWVEQNATLDLWVTRLATALCASAKCNSQKSRVGALSHER